VPFVAVVLAVIFIVQNSTPSTQQEQRISITNQHLVAAT
jgi:hypothetical protein